MLAPRPTFPGTLAFLRGLWVVGTSLFASGLVASGCGGAPVDVDAAYRRIQVHEAHIAHAGHELEAASAEERTERCATICDASAAIATEARALPGDADAEERARRASLTCAACAGEATP